MSRIGQNYFYSVGLIFTDDEIQEMVQEADIDGDQHVSFDEFRDIFFESWKFMKKLFSIFPCLPTSYNLLKLSL